MGKTNLVLEHVEQGCFTSIIEAEEQDLSFFLPETKGGKNAVEPIDKEHRLSLSIRGSGIPKIQNGSKSKLERSERVEEGE